MFNKTLSNFTKNSFLCYKKFLTKNNNLIKTKMPMLFFYTITKEKHEQKSEILNLKALKRC